MFDPIYEAIGWLLALFYAAVPNLGISIILLTFTVMLLLYPLTAKQARSMIAMQMVQPEIKRIQAKYKNDRAKLNEEMMKFYQENKINPLAGCLPLLVQLPIFFALFQVLKNPYKWVPFDSKLYEAFCTTNQGQVVGVKRCGDGPFNYLPTHQKFLGIDLSVTAPNQITTWATIASFALVILVMFTGYMQSRQAQKRTPAVNKQMAMLTKVLPLLFGFFSLNFPAGLVLYFFVSNLWRLGQQEVIFRRFGTAANPKHRSLLKPPKANVIDAESRERTDTAVDVLEVEAGEEASPKPTGGATKGRPKAGAKPAAGAAAKSDGKTASPGNRVKAVAPPPKSGGGLRSLFQLPPPPGEAPKPASAPAPRKSSSSSPSKSASSSTARPGQAGRRTSKKKRKR
jgi:YidC/Oxa1 family membrane protein insertase